MTADNNVSITAKSPSGFELTLSLTDQDTATLMKRALSALDWLKAKGFEPAATTGTPAIASTNGNGAAPTCAYHGAMKPSTKKPGSWYCPAKMADGSYCQEKATN